jgi:hypothetical protein
MLMALLVVVKEGLVLQGVCCHGSSGGICRAPG